MKKESVQEQPTTDSSSPIAEAIHHIRLAQEHLAAGARERAAKELSTGSLAAITQELNQLVRRMSVYVKD